MNPRRDGKKRRETSAHEDVCIGAVVGCGACIALAWGSSLGAVAVAAIIGLGFGAAVGLLLWIASMKLPDEAIGPPGPGKIPPLGANPAGWRIGTAGCAGCKSYRRSKPYCEAYCAWQVVSGREQGNTICRRASNGGERMKSRRKLRRPGPTAPPQGEPSLPHERDEAPEPVTQDAHETTGPRDLIEQAARDIARGLRDTDRHGIPSDVPGPGPDPEQSPGAEVPPAGVDAGANPHKHGSQ